LGVCCVFAAVTAARRRLWTECCTCLEATTDGGTTPPCACSTAVRRLLLLRCCVCVEFGLREGSHATRPNRFGCGPNFFLQAATHTWSQNVHTYGPVPEGRNGHTATLAGRKIYILGGWLGIGPYAASDMHILDVGAFLGSRSEIKRKCRGDSLVLLSCGSVYRLCQTHSRGNRRTRRASGQVRATCTRLTTSRASTPSWCSGEATAGRT